MIFYGAPWEGKGGKVSLFCMDGAVIDFSSKNFSVDLSYLFIDKTELIEYNKHRKEKYLKCDGSDAKREEL